MKQSAGKPVDVVTDAASTYVKLRDGKNEIELQETELRFKKHQGRRRYLPDGPPRHTRQ